MNYKFIFMLKVVMKFVIIASFMVRVFPIRELKPGFIGGGNHSGSQLYFHIARYMLKEKGGHFLGAKSESRVSAPFFASKRV